MKNHHRGVVADGTADLIAGPAGPPNIHILTATSKQTFSDDYKCIKTMLISAMEVPKCMVMYGSADTCVW